VRRHHDDAATPDGLEDRHHAGQQGDDRRTRRRLDLGARFASSAPSASPLTEVQPTTMEWGRTVASSRASSGIAAWMPRRPAALDSVTNSRAAWSVAHRGRRR